VIYRKFGCVPIVSVADILRVMSGS
jgi:hypothetical protein